MRKEIGIFIISGLLMMLVIGGSAPSANALHIIQVNSDEDDATERGTGAFTSVGTAIDMYSHTDNTSLNYRCGGFRFEGIPIDQGEHIENAYLELYFSTQTDINVLIFAEDTDTTLDFVSNPSIIDNSTRPKTENYVEWIENGLSINAWDNSDNIAAVLQEVVDRPGWNSGRSITLLLIAKNDQILSSNARSYDFSTVLAAKLHFHWQPTIDGTRYPLTALPQSTINIRQVLVSHGQEATDITAKITFDHENFRFLDGYPENVVMVENLEEDGSLFAEWYVATPDIEDNYKFNVEWEFIHEDYHSLLSDNYNIEVRYPLVPTPHTIPVFPLSSDATAIAVVAIGLALCAFAGMMINRREGVNMREEGREL